MIYGYARCSTNETMQDIERQTRELEKEIAPSSVEIGNDNSGYSLIDCR